MAQPETTAATAPTRIVIVADVRLYREGLTAIIPRERIQVVGSADTRETAAATVQTERPDAVLVDLAMPGALELMRQLRVDPPFVNIIAFGVADDIALIVACAEAGAVAYVGLTASVEDLVVAIRDAVAGELQCTPRVAGELFRHVGEQVRTNKHVAAAPEPSELTNRQRQVLALLRQNLSNKEIGQALNISEATVKNHVHQLLDKLQVSNRAKAAACLPRPNRTAVRSRWTTDVSMFRESRA